MGAEARADGPRYKAFISYSHADAAFGRRLHRWLESYALPRRLVGRPGRLGPVPGRLGPIFRDREELAAAGDLSVEVRNALGQSACLIVVCSPRAAASPWVGREIGTFRALHPDRPILAALVEGHPEQAFPTLLSEAGAEPLAADFRPEGDGQRLARLKLAAGIAGVSLDQLVQRDAQRRLAQTTAAAAVLMLATLAMGAMLVVAVQARAEAEHQRAEGESLIKFMLTDLRGQLKGVGRLDIMTTVNRRALAHYQQIELPRMSAGARALRVKALVAMIEDNERRGDLAAGMAQITEAWRTTRALLDEAPDQPDRIFLHAQSEFWLGMLSWRLGLVSDAEEAWRRYANLADRLVAKDAANPDWQIEAGDAESNLGAVALRGRYDARLAEQRFANSLQHFQLALRLRPDDADILQLIADGHGWLADSLRAQARFDEARAERGRELDALRTLQSRDPANVSYARDRLGNELGLARIDMDQGRVAVANVRLAAAYAEAKRLANGDTQDEKLARQRIAIGLFLAKTEMALGRSDVSALLRDCNGQLASRDEELQPLCAIVRAQAGRAAGRVDEGMEAYLLANRDRLSKIRMSRRWGIDFQRELILLNVKN